MIWRSCEWQQPIENACHIKFPVLSRKTILQFQLKRGRASLLGIHIYNNGIVSMIDFGRFTRQSMISWLVASTKVDPRADQNPTIQFTMHV